MCGRFPQSKAIDKYMKRLRAQQYKFVESMLPPSWNVAPSRPVWTVRLEEQTLEATPRKWGLSDGSTGMAPINARVETAPSKIMFRDSWQHRRCLVPADGWYEWKAEAGGKQPYYFTRRDGEPVYFAGIWKGETFCMFTMNADGPLASVHHRKPVSLDVNEAHEWLKAPLATEALQQMAVPADAINFFPVGKGVSNWRNDGPSLIEPEARSQLNLL